MVKLALRIVPYLKGYSHIQTNPKYAYDKQKTVENGKRESIPEIEEKENYGLDSDDD